VIIMTYQLELLHNGKRMGRLDSESWTEIDTVASTFSRLDKLNHYTITRDGAFVLACYPSTSIFM